jgi:hypothetical protein
MTISVGLNMIASDRDAIPVQAFRHPVIGLAQSGPRLVAEQPCRRKTSGGNSGLGRCCQKKVFSG